MEEPKTKPIVNESVQKKIWNFLKVRKIWWITPIVILLILFLISFLSGGVSLASIYAPV